MIVSETGEPDVNSPIADNSGVNGQSAFSGTNPRHPFCNEQVKARCVVGHSHLGAL